MRHYQPQVPLLFAYFLVCVSLHTLIPLATNYCALRLAYQISNSTTPHQHSDQEQRLEIWDTSGTCPSPGMAAAPNPHRTSRPAESEF